MSTLEREISGVRDVLEFGSVVRLAARRINAADGATVVLKEGEQCFYVDESAVGPLWKGKKFPLVSCISGWAMMNKASVAIENIFLDSRIPADLYRPTFVKSLAMVPVVQHAPLAAIGNYWAVRHRPDADEIYRLEKLASVVASSLARLCNMTQ